MAVEASISPVRLGLSEVAVGHDVLALISSAMYTEPLTVYRELCQNAADAIDEAIASGLLSDGMGRVDITIDPQNRSILIRDNGAGISNADFPRRMCSIGASRKRGTTSRGFRGIGRLVGLGYCQELVFRSRSAAAERVLEATWDCRALRDALRSPEFTSLADVVAAVVTVTSCRPTADDPPNFFEVELRKVIRLSNDSLLSSSLVEAYLGEVAPVPFHRSFSHGSAIATHLREHTSYSTVDVFINQSERAVTRPYRDVLPISSSKATALEEPIFFEFPSQDGGLGAVGWLAHHEYLGAFPRHLGVRGVRARVGNLQIGDDSCFDSVFSETRFNQWTVGELHVTDPKIVANGRRDYFEPNLHFENLCNHLTTVAQDVARRCRTLSASRRKERSLVDLETSLAAYSRLLKRSRVARIMRDELIDDVAAQVERSRRQLTANDPRSTHLSRIEERLESLAGTVTVESSRATQRQMGQADVLRLLREHVAGGANMSVQLLKLLTDQS